MPPLRPHKLPENTIWDGTSFAVSGSNDGPPVVLVHGMGLNLAMWQGQLASLEQRFKVLRYDLLGHGDSVARAGPYRMDDFVRQLTALLDHLDIEHCHLVGFSLGGLIVQAFAVAHGNRVDRLAILNAGFDRSAEERAGIIERLQVALDNGHGATVAGALKRWFTPDFAARRPDVIERVRLWMEANDANIYPEIYRVLAYGDQALAGTISTIQAPTLVLTCSDDSGSPPAMVARMARAMPHAELAIVAGLKHMGLMEDPPAINNILMPFLIG